MQLVELQEYWQQLRNQGWGLATITYDSPEILADFAQRHGITFPMLSDLRSKIIKDFGILNTAIPRDVMQYGIPNPGTYMVDADGAVRSKYFLADEFERYSTPTILLREFGSVEGTRETVVNTDRLELKYYATRDVLRAAVRFTLVLDFDLKDKVHVYAPGAQHYIPLSLELDSSRYFHAERVKYPQPQILYLAAIKETVSVFEGRFRITQDLTTWNREVIGTMRELKINGRLRYQACDDKICYLPETIPLEWNFKIDNGALVRGRAPEQIMHPGKTLRVETGVTQIASGPEVRQRIPSFRAFDQTNKMQDFDSIRGPNGALIVFFQSADWDFYSKWQLLDLQRYKEEFGKQGLSVAAISYDSVAILADFAKRKGITFPMLSDPQSTTIKAFGILNNDIPKTDMRFGIAHPGAYLVNADGVVQSKYFSTNTKERYSAATILLREFGSVASARKIAVKTNYLDLTYYCSTDVASANSRITFVADFDLKPHIRVVAPGAQKYVPISLELDDSSSYVTYPPEYPGPETLKLADKNATFSSYQGKFRIIEDITIGGKDTLSGLPSIEIKGRLHFQACDDERACYIPQAIPVELRLKMEPVDYERPPEQIQHTDLGDRSPAR
jgi:peroxiredoxin Q/BCP